MANVSTSAQLRTAIQNASSLDPTISVASGSYSTITTLAKLPSYYPQPAVAYNGYSIIGTTPRETTIINDTRVYQQNVDGPFAPSTVQNLNLQYNSATTNNSAILSARSGSYTLDNLLITGQHSGWAGNGGVYMSLIGQTNSSTTITGAITANLTLSNSTVNFSGNNQNGTASFLQSWNNAGTVSLNNNVFNESGYSRGSFHFATMRSSGGTVSSSNRKGTYSVTGNTFNGTGTYKSSGNRIESIAPTVTGNTFNNGSYLDIAGNTSGNISSNTFNTIYDANALSMGGQGGGIRFCDTSSSGAMLVQPNGGYSNIGNNTFTGYGLAITFKATATNKSILLNSSTSPLNKVTFGTGTPLGSNITMTEMIAGGQNMDSLVTGMTAGANYWVSGDKGDDMIMGNEGNDYIIGGLGSDEIDTGSGTDTILYYATNEGEDTINDFSTGDDVLAFRGNTSGSPNFFDFAPGSSLTSGTNFITSGASATNAVPTFIYFGGVLSYDADGSGGGAAVNIATFTGSPTIAASDIKFF
ncbi:MAG: hypothetical protein ACK5QQ_12000 [Cyanobacteriota bacterium]